MSKRLLLAITAATAMLAALPVMAASAATSDVLTTGKVGGPNVAVGAIVKAPLKTGTKATFVNGSTTISCSKASVTDKVTKNPAAKGTAVESLTAQTFSGCTVNVTGVTVKSVKVLKLPYTTTISDASGDPITVSKLSTQITLNAAGSSFNCTYVAAKIKGNASNVGNVNSFKNQKFTLSSGPALCLSSGSFSATFGPLKDTSVSGSPAVFVN